MTKIQQLIPFVKPFYTLDDPAHDWPHVGRVLSMAFKLAQGVSVDLVCLEAAVYCHDLVNLPKNHPDRSQASFLGAEKAAPLLKHAGLSENEIKKIQQIILEHSFSKGLRPTSLEAAILQDADRLDSLGAIGILRCASVNTQMKTSFYDPSDPFAEKRELDDKKYMLDHYFVKIFRLPDLMNTEAGRIEAHKRVEFMKSFLYQLRQEINRIA
jgi:uncharacterized protein